jgi:hypothetical protein
MTKKTKRPNQPMEPYVRGQRSEISISASLIYGTVADLVLVRSMISRIVQIIIGSAEANMLNPAK